MDGGSIGREMIDNGIDRIFHTHTANTTRFMQLQHTADKNKCIGKKEIGISQIRFLLQIVPTWRSSFAEKAHSNINQFIVVVIALKPSCILLYIVYKRYGYIGFRGGYECDAVERLNLWDGWWLMKRIACCSMDRWSGGFTNDSFSFFTCAF